MRSPFSALARTGVLAACVLSTLPAAAEDKGILMIEQKLGSHARDQIRAWRDQGEQVTVRCDVWTTPGPLKTTSFHCDPLAKGVAGAIQDLDSENPGFSFGPFAVGTGRSLDDGAGPDATVELMFSIDIRSSNPERLPWRSLAAKLAFAPEEYLAFKKTVETQGVLWSAGSHLFAKSAWAPLSATQEPVASKGAGATETKKAS